MSREQTKSYLALKAIIEEILFRHDPIGINFEDNTDEYAPEASTIIPRLREASSALDVQKIIHEEFAEWFDEELAGPISRYKTLAVEIWQEWVRLTRPVR